MTTEDNRYPATLTDLQAAEAQLTTVRKVHAEAAARLETKRAELARLKNSKVTLLEQLGAGEGDPAKLSKIDTDTATAAAVITATEETVTLVQRNVEAAETAVYRAETAVRRALLHEWPKREKELKEAALAIAAPALRQWWRAHLAACASFPSNAIPADTWLRRSDIANALGMAIKAAPDMPIDIPHEPPESDLLTFFRRLELARAE